MNRTSFLNAYDFIKKYQIDERIIICVFEDCGDDISMQIENPTAYLSIGFNDDGTVSWFAKSKEYEGLYDGEFEDSLAQIDHMMLNLGLK